MLIPSAAAAAAAPTAPSLGVAPPRHARWLVHWLALGACLGPLLFTCAWIVLGMLQPPVQTPFGVLGGGSGAISNPVSGLGVGPNAGLFNLAFVGCGLLQLVGVIAAVQTIRSPGHAALQRVSSALLAVSPFGLAMAGIFTLAAALPLHVVAALLLFVSPVVSFAVAGVFLRRTPGWQRLGTLLLAASPLTLLLFVGYSMSFDQATVAAGGGIAGLSERVMLLEVQAWYVILGGLAFRRSRDSTGAGLAA